MVSTKVNKRKTVARKKARAAALRNPLKIAVLLAIFIAGAISIYFVLSYFLNKNTPSETNSAIVEPESEPEPEPEVVLPDKIDFQPIVDEWVQSVGGNRSVLIYDLDRDEVAGEYNTKEDYGTASLYKLFVVYEGYRRLQSGEWQADEPAGSTGYTILKCLDLAIRESYSPCAETLWAKIGQSNLDGIIENDFKITNSTISKLVSNPEDIMKMMKIFYERPEITDASLVDVMKDSFLNQPTTTYNWRQGLPSGFSKAKVYNKVGWDFNPNTNSWNIYHDAAIVEFPEQNRHFIVVVMTNQIPYQQISKLGSMIEESFY